MKALTRLAAALARPMVAQSRFFVYSAIAGCLTVLTFATAEHARVLRFIIAAAAESVLMAWCLAAIAACIRNRTLRICFMTCCCLALTIPVIADIGTILTTGVPLTSDSVGLIAETNIHEASGFFTQYFSLRVACWLGMTGILTALTVTYGSRLLRSALASRRTRPWTVATVAVMMAAGAVCWGRLANGTLIRDLQRLMVWESGGAVNPDLSRIMELRYAAPYIKYPYLCNKIRLQNANTADWEETQRQAAASLPDSDNGLDFNIVFVIGESFIRAHSQLYGYYLPTNPRLSLEKENGRLVVFDDIISCANFTTPSLRNLMNLNSLADGEQWYESVYFPLLLRKAGWDVYHYDNQTIDSAHDSGISRMFYAPTVISEVCSGVSDSLFTYDGDYIDYVSRTMPPLAGNRKRLVIYHLAGQHFPASQRYPGPGHFTAADITADRPWLTPDRRTEVAEYDNATLYNDSVVAAIASRWSDSPTLMIYFSDHGEDIWDLAPIEARNKPFPDDPAWLDRQYRVPFMAWFSEPFREKYPELVARIEAAAARPGMLDNVGQAVLGLSGVPSPYYRPERDITSDNYTPARRVTSEGYVFD